MWRGGKGRGGRGGREGREGREGGEGGREGGREDLKVPQRENVKDYAQYLITHQPCDPSISPSTSPCNMT